MSKLRISLNTIESIIAIVVGIITIAIVIVAIAHGRNRIESLERQIADYREKNQQLFSLLVDVVSQQKVSPLDLMVYLSKDETTEIVEKAGITTTVKFPFELETEFYPSGWMGDGEEGEKYISYSHVSANVAGEEKIVIRIEYNRGPSNWAGIYWQSPANNWGDNTGKNLTGAKQIVFLARGEKGNEIIEFKAGGIDRGRYPDSFSRSTGKVKVSKMWQKFRIDLSNEDLSNVIGAFAWIAAANDNKGRLTFYIADLIIE